MNENLKVCLETLYDKFINFYTKNIVEIFQREFSEENVDYKQKVPTFEDFTIRVLNAIRVFDVDGESIILCDGDTGYNQGYDRLCNIEDIEDEEDSVHNIHCIPDCIMFARASCNPCRNEVSVQVRYRIDRQEHSCCPSGKR